MIWFFSRKFHSINVITQTHIRYHSAHRLSESISRYCCFFRPPHTTTAFSMGWEQPKPEALTYLPLLCLWSLSGSDSQCLCATCTLWGSLPEAVGGKRLRSVYECDGAHLHMQGADGHALFVVHGSHGCTDRKYLPVGLCQMKTCRVEKNKTKQTKITIWSHSWVQPWATETSAVGFMLLNKFV